jgi:hypothetical protein
LTTTGDFAGNANTGIGDFGAFQRLRQCPCGVEQSAGEVIADMIGWAETLVKELYAMQLK